MKLIFVIFLGLSIPLVLSEKRSEREDPLFISSDIIERFLQEMPMKPADYYSKHFYPDVVKALNRKLYHHKSHAKRYNEKRIRNIKLNQFLSIPKERDQSLKSSYAFLTNSSSQATPLVIYTVRDNSKSKQLIDVHSADTVCLFGMSEERTAVKAKACREDVPNMRWNLIPNTYGDYWIQQEGTKLCLAPVLGMEKAAMIQLLTCNKYDPYIIWEIQDAYLYF